MDQSINYNSEKLKTQSTNEKVNATSEADKWNNLFSINPNDEAHFLFDKWGLPIKKKGIEQPTTVEAERTKRQQWCQQELNLFLSGDPFYTFDPTPKVLCGALVTRAIFNPIAAQAQPIPEAPQDPEPEFEFQYPVLPPTPPSTEATTESATSRSHSSLSLPSLQPLPSSLSLLSFPES